MPTANASLTSQDFVTSAAISDKYEIRAARLAEQRSHSPAVDRFARKMIEDHSQSTAKLKMVVAHTGNLDLPAGLNAQHRGLIEQLERVDGRQFEAVYAQQQVQAHEDAVELFSSYRRNGDNPRLRRFAAEVFPVIQHHLDMARALPGGPQIARGR